MSICSLSKKMAKNLFINKIVYALTNRRSDFPDGMIPDTNMFKPKAQPQIWTSLQAGLNLNSKETDYYILVALNLLDAYPDIKDLFGDSHLSFDPSEIFNYRTTIDGASFYTRGNTVGRAISYMDYFPMAHRYTIRANTDTSVMVETDLGRNFYVKCSVMPKGSGSSLDCQWNDRLPFRGPLITKYPWRDTSRVDIKYIPQSIDYDKWVDYIEDKLSVEKALSPVGLYTAYQLITSGAERIALLTVALAIQNTSLDDGQGAKK